MKCPHCKIDFHDSETIGQLAAPNADKLWYYKTNTCSACKKIILKLSGNNGGIWLQVYPQGSSRNPVPQEVPKDIAEDYTEACLVLPISAKASAALARRCLQAMLHAHGYKGRDLAVEIDMLLNDTDPKKAIPSSLRMAVDAIRNFGNFSAHPITDKTSLQIIAVQPEEAEWCLETVEEMFDHFYVRPAQMKAKKAALDAKLQAAGKPPSKN